MIVRLPVRIDFIGGWTDQVSWHDSAAVVNAAVGWDDAYPMYYDATGLHSSVSGIGTGLGISSIARAGQYIYEQAGSLDGYIPHVLTWEEREGAQGGWQDQMGGIEPGLKLVTSTDHRSFSVDQRDDHPIMERVVLFDTGIRRPSKSLGDKVRSLMAAPGHFNETLRHAAKTAPVMFESDNADRAIHQCLAIWRLLVAYVPEMDVAVPYHPECIGHKLCGAGGGGYGIAFATSPEAREAIIETYRQHGWWATVPQLLQGAHVED